MITLLNKINTAIRQRVTERDSVWRRLSEVTSELKGEKDPIGQKALRWADRKANAKSLRRQRTWHVGGMGRRPVCLEPEEKERWRQKASLEQ